MMNTVIVSIFLVCGIFFFYVGTIGLLRFPDTLSRAHAAAKCDTLGAALCIAGLVVYGGISFSSAKMVLAVMFLWLTNPTATHLIGKSVFFDEKKSEGVE